jgi:4-hydroxybenzoate polyprenyltransferase
MISRSTLLHCRFPFSFFLLPVFLLAVVCTAPVDYFRVTIVFIVWHFFLYPASNGFNSYYDRDVDSIGGLRAPPPVTGDLLPFTVVLNAIGVGLALLVSWQFAAGAIVYIAASTLYSHPVARIKRFAVVSWLMVGIGQGGLVFLLTAQSVSGASSFVMRPVPLLPVFSAVFFILGVYPLTQIYQHEEDNSRGDRTISVAVGCLGTFYLAALCLAAAIVGFVIHFYQTGGLLASGLFCLTLIAAIIHFFRWYLACRRDRLMADWDNLMRMNYLASTGLVFFAVVMFVF